MNDLQEGINTKTMNIRQFLEKYKSEHIFYCPNPGNGGDALIAYATYQLLKEEGIEYTIIKGDEELTDKIVFYAGGGNFVDEYRQAADFIRKNVQKVRELVILPHTINGHKQLIVSFDEKVTVLCRERLSYQYITELNSECKCFLVEDLAFSLPIKSLRSKLRKNIVPVFFRLNVLKMFRHQQDILFPVFNILFGTVLNAFRIDAERTAIERPKGNLDLSVLILYDRTMQNEDKVEKNAIDFLSAIDKYDEVSTNRLHICIGAALLGKKVHFYPNSYYKNESIYLMSLKDKFPNVQWCSELKTLERPVMSK
ncbi:polysaccharide pyruvyl transferase family protein [Arcticibacter sp. MXS-1]|uniref:polysaccharide pyruvyl transferase family protein n=1 Tax=Arcticibacter sp. MXS-1 TaxID=3341726 RepID=UPI0035A8809C